MPLLLKMFKSISILISPTSNFIADHADPIIFCGLAKLTICLLASIYFQNCFTGFALFVTIFDLMQKLYWNSCYFILEFLEACNTERNLHPLLGKD